ncbi:MAG: ATP-binding protein [Thermoplasmata archaeon]
MESTSPDRTDAASVGSIEGRPVPLFGRDDVLDEILRALDAARDGGGRALFLVGQGGVGKTTVLRAAARAARSKGFRVLSSRALPVDLPEPFYLIKALVRESEREQAERRATSLEPPTALPLFVAPYDDEVPSTPPPTGSVPETSEAAQEALRLIGRLSNPTERVDSSRSSLFGRLSDFFLRLTAHAPIVLAIDDLHFASDSSLEFLREFLPLIESSRIVIVATVSPASEAPERTSPALEALRGLPNAAAIPIRAMSEVELGQFVRWLLHGRDPGRETLMRWFTQTEGNPRFVEHLVRGTTGLGGAAAPLGEGVELDFAEVLRARIRGLGEPEMRVLVYGAVLGHEFDFASLTRACGQEEERLSESLDRLVHQGILREQGGEVYEFVSESARSDIYAQLTDTRRRILHRKAAQAIEARGTLSSTAVYELARQFYLARDDVKALEYNRRAADLSAEAFAFDTAVVFLERAVESSRRLPDRDLATELRLLIELGRYLDELGELRRSEEIFLDAVARARFETARATELALALLGLAQTRSDLSEYASARSLASEAFRILERQGNQRGLLAAHRVLGVAAWRMGDLSVAERHQRAELEIAEREGTPSDRGHAMIDLANTFILGGPARVPEALALYERAAAVFASGEDHSAHARVLMNRALLHHNAGRMPAAVADMQEALRAAERSHSRIWIGYCSLNMAQLRAEEHDPTAARRELTRATSLLEPLGDQLAHQQSVMIGGMIAEEEKDYGAGETAFAEALRLAQQLSLGAEIAEMCFRLARLAFLRGDREGARRFLGDADRAGFTRLRGDLLEDLHRLQDEIDRPVALDHR